MLRLTTNVTVSPASSARSSSAAGAHVLDRLGPRLGEQRRQLVSGQRARRRAPRSIAPADEVAPDRARRLAAARAAARDEAPVARLDDVEHALGHPLRVDVAAGRRTAARSARRRPAPAACAPGAGDGNGCSGEMWSPLALQPAEVRRARGDELAATSRPGSAGPGSPTSGSSRRASAHQRASCRRSRPASPTPGAVAVRRVGDAGAPVALGRLGRRSRPAPRRSSGGAGRSSGGSPPAGGRARRAPRPAPRATRSGRPRTRRCRRGSRS